MMPPRNAELERKRLENETIEMLKKHDLLMEDSVSISGKEYLALKNGIVELDGMKSSLNELKSTLEHKNNQSQRYEKNWVKEIEKVQSLKKEIDRLNNIIALGSRAYLLDPDCSGPSIKVNEALIFWLDKVQKELELGDFLNPTSRLVKMDGKDLLRDKDFSTILLDALKKRYEPEGWDVAILTKGISFSSKKDSLGLVKIKNSNIFLRLFSFIRNKARSLFM